MTEQDAIDCLEDMITEGSVIGDRIYPLTEAAELRIAIRALKEVQLYRAIGTVEACREAMGRRI